MIVATFDAELFGHWWFEGPQFLRDVLLTLNADPDVQLVTAAQFLDRHPPDKVVSVPEGSWGEGGDHGVWTNEKVAWMWEIEYRCEAAFGNLTDAERLEVQDADVHDLVFPHIDLDWWNVQAGCCSPPVVRAQACRP